METSAIAQQSPTVSRSPDDHRDPERAPQPPAIGEPRGSSPPPTLSAAPTSTCAKAPRLGCTLTIKDTGPSSRSPNVPGKARAEDDSGRRPSHWLAAPQARRRSPRSGHSASGQHRATPWRKPPPARRAIRPPYRTAFKNDRFEAKTTRNDSKLKGIRP